MNPATGTNPSTGTSAPVSVIPSTTPQAGQGNFLERLLPTAGGILGGIVGLPGDFLGGAGSIAGASIGDTLGKALENNLTGNSVTSGLGGAALEGGIGQGIGGAVGGLLGKAGSGLASAGTKMATDTAEQAASEESSKAAVDEATRIKNEFGGVKGANVGDALTQAQNLGVTNPTADDLVNIGRTYTGSNPEPGTGVLNFYKNQALDQAGGNVDLSGVTTNLDKTLSAPEVQSQIGSTEPVSSARGQLPKAPKNVATSIVQQVRNMLPAMQTGADSTLESTVSPKDAQSLLKTIGSKIEQSTPKPNALGSIDPAQQTENSVWKSVYSDVKSALYNRPEVDAAVQGIHVGPDESAVIDDALKSNNITDPQVSANVKANLSSTLNNAQTAQDLLTAERPMVNVSKVGEQASADIASNPQTARGVARVKRAVGAGAPPPPTGTGAGALDMLGGAGMATGHPVGALANIASRAHKAGLTPSIAKSLGSVLTKIAPFAGATGVAATDAGSLGAAPENNVSSGTGTTMQQQPMGTDPNSLATILSTLMQQEQAAPATFASSLGPVIGQLAPLVQKQQLAGGVANNLEPAYAGAGGAQGTGGGILSQISALIPGTAANTYQRQQQATASTLAQLLGISPEAAMQLTPQLTQNPTSAGITGNNLSSILGNISAVPTQ